MAREINYNYYGVDTTVWPSNGENVAKMVKGNTWNYYYGEPPETFGKPFDDSVAIWRLMPNASFACPGYIYVKTGNTLQAEFKVNQNDNTIPLVMQATSDSDNYTTYPHYRIADNYTNNEKLVYSRLCYDINPQKFCLMPQAVLWDRTTDPNNSAGGVTYKSLGNVASTVNGNNNYKIVTIRAFMYFGGNQAPRSRDGQYLTTNLLDPNQIQQPCVPMAEPYAYRPLPDDANMKKRMRYMFSNVEHLDWTTDKVFNPFNHCGGGYWYSSLSAPTSTDTQYNIGVLRSWTRSQIQSGATAIPDTGGRISGQWIYCNFERKDFDDVSYHWRSYVWDAEHKVEVNNGLPLTSISSSSYLRLVTELVIDDRKGNTLGQATANAMKHEIAYIGFYFGDDSSYAANSVLGDQGTGVGIYLPKRVDGIPNGEYYTGEDLVNSDEAKQTNTDDWYNDGETNPISGDEGDWNSQEHIRIGAGEGGPDYWVLNDTEMNNFVTFVNTSVIKVIKPDINDYPDTPEGHAQYETDLDAYYQAIEAQKNEVGVQWGGADPFNYIVCCKWYPWEVDDVINSTHETIHIAQVNTSIETPFLYKKTKLWDMGSFYIEERYHNWKDYQIQINLMLPFIGTMGLDPQLYVGHTINVKYSIDWRTGDATAYIYRDGQCMDSASGSVGIDIPLTLAAAGSYQAQIGAAEMQKAQIRRQAALGAISFAAGLALSIATGGFGMSAGIANGMIGAIGRTATMATLAAAEVKLASTVAKAGLQFAQQIQSLNYQIDHTPLTLGEVSSASPFNNITQDYRTALIITYPAMQDDYVDEDAYGKTVGHACCRVVSKIKGDRYESKYKGYIQATNAILDGIPCRTEERQTIASLLQSGIINNT